MRSLLDILKNILQKLSTKTETVLLWTNPNTGSEYGQNDITLPNDIESYDFCDVVFLDIPDGGSVFIVRCQVKPYPKGSQAMQVRYNNGWYYHHRSFWWDNRKLHIDNNYWNHLEGTSSGTANDKLIPYHIYGIKLGGGY